MKRDYSLGENLLLCGRDMAKKGLYDRTRFCTSSRRRNRLDEGGKEKMRCRTERGVITKLFKFSFSKSNS